MFVAVLIYSLLIADYPLRAYSTISILKAK
jgi:hypothetical protein